MLNQLPPRLLSLLTTNLQEINIYKLNTTINRKMKHPSVGSQPTNIHLVGIHETSLQSIQRVGFGNPLNIHLGSFANASKVNLGRKAKKRP